MRRGRDSHCRRVQPHLLSPVAWYRLRSLRAAHRTLCPLDRVLRRDLRSISVGCIGRVLPVLSERNANSHRPQYLNHHGCVARRRVPRRPILLVLQGRSWRLSFPPGPQKYTPCLRSGLTKGNCRQLSDRCLLGILLSASLQTLSTEMACKSNSELGISCPVS